MEPKTALRGQEVFIDLPNAPEAAPKNLVVLLGDYPAENPIYGVKSIRFTVPKFTSAKSRFPLNVYFVTVWLDNRHFDIGELNVAASLQGQPVVDRIVPEVAYLKIDDPVNIFGGGKGAWTILGKGFAENSRDDIKLLINGSQHDVIWGDSCAADAVVDKSKIYGVVRNAQELVVCNVPVVEQGRLSLAVRQGAETSKAASATATRWPRPVVPLMGLLVTVLIGALIWSLIASKRAHVIRGKEYKLRAVLLDKQTNTYSLSILQFLLWTTAGVFGYVYLALSRMFVQRLDIPDVPGTLPAIVGIGMGAVTAVAAQAINMVHPKGSGEEEPSPSDLVTSGGSVAPDRVQMVAWTIVGVLAFLAGVIRENPASMLSLPAIPDTLMALMGLSSVGYLGAKFARKPGPNILELSILPTVAGTAGSAPVPEARADVSKPLAVASQALQAVKAAAAGLSGNAAPAAVRAANEAVSALDTAVGVVTEIGKAQGPGLPKVAELAGTAHEAAVRAAGEFDSISGAAGAETARLSAAIAQRAAAALEDLSADAGQVVSVAEAAEAKRRKEAEQTFRRVIELRGMNLSSEGVFHVKVGESELDLPFRMLEMQNNRRGPTIVVPEENTGTATLARVLRLTIVPSELDPGDRLTYDAIFGRPGKEITLTLANPDGQRATKTFSFPPGTASRE